MRQKHTQVHALTLTYRPLLARIAVVLLLAISIWLIVISRTNSNITATIRMKISDAVVPVVEILAKPMDAVSSVGAWVHEMATMREENRTLKSEISRLRLWHSSAIELKNENDKLHALLKFAPDSKTAYTSARIAIDAGSPYTHSALITSGEDQGVQEDSAVINDSGLVGRVIDVGKKTAHVLLLTDVNSRIPVMSETSREHSIAGGGNGDSLSLLYMPENSVLKVGEKIVTSGDGGVLPPGLPVGVVTKIEKDVATVKPYVDWYRLEYVSVVDFSE